LLSKRNITFLTFCMTVILIAQISISVFSYAAVGDRDEKSTSIYTGKPPEGSTEIPEETTTYQHGSEPIPVIEESTELQGWAAARLKGWGCFSLFLKIILFILIIHLSLQAITSYQRWRREKELRNF
jgi:hypothetical protein